MYTISYISHFCHNLQNDVIYTLFKELFSSKKSYYKEIMEIWQLWVCGEKAGKRCLLSLKVLWSKKESTLRRKILHFLYFNVSWHQLFVYKRFTFGVYIHVCFVVLKVGYVECSQITKIMLALQKKLGPGFFCCSKYHSVGSLVALITRVWVFLLLKIP